MASEESSLETAVLTVDARKIGRLTSQSRPNDLLDELAVDLDRDSQDAQYLLAAAEQLRTSDIPVAFPTETVYGLGADATRSNAVRGIYQAKKRPADNPLICHFASLDQIRTLLRHGDTDNNDNPSSTPAKDPISEIYHPLIRRFWPGPLTILLPVPSPSPLAPEVTASLSTFGARIPRHPLALALIKLADRPLAAPSANASTKPSPTAAEHVLYDLDGRIEMILDGGPCDVGVESTVVDGLCSPPVVLRPGGVNLEMLRSCEGWEDVRVGYGDVAEKGPAGPRAPGMKYRHYSPKAKVVLFESGAVGAPKWADLEGKVGIVRTRRWEVNGEGEEGPISCSPQDGKTLSNGSGSTQQQSRSSGFEGMLATLHHSHARREISTHHLAKDGNDYEVLDISLGSSTADIARGVFAALRDLDRAGVDKIFVEGISDREGDEGAAAVMNRLRKAAEVEVKD